jgi:hypothetical protein
VREKQETYSTDDPPHFWPAVVLTMGPIIPPCTLNRMSKRTRPTFASHVAALQDEDTDLSDMPEVTAEQMARLGCVWAANPLRKVRCL